MDLVSRPTPMVAAAAFVKEGHMPTFHLLKSDCIPLTRALAEEFRDMEPSPTERALKPNRIKYLQQQAGAGELVSFHWATVTREGVMRRMNGQHSSRMLCELDGFFPQGLFVHRDDYNVDDEEGEAQLFRKFDNRVSARSALDVAGAYQHLYPELRHLNPSTAKLAIDGIAWYLTTIEAVSVPSGDDRYTLFDHAQASMAKYGGKKGAYHNFLLWIDGVITVATPELKRAPVVAAMYGTFTKNETEARQFWQEVAQGGNETTEDNQFRLDMALKGVRDRESGPPPKPGEFFEGCVKVWNAHRAGRSVKDVKFTVDKRKGLSEPSE
jgi:hypothetical protein